MKRKTDKKQQNKKMSEMEFLTKSQSQHSQTLSTIMKPILYTKPFAQRYAGLR